MGSNSPRRDGYDVGPRKYALLPTLFWLSSTNTALVLVCGLGLVSALLVFALRLVWPMLALAWLCHLSFLSIGGPFLSFQWDALLSEMGVLALLAVPIGWRRPEPLVLVAIGRWLLLWLLIRLLFGSGWVKLAVDDPTWRNLTALDYHFETQPLPTLLGYYAHALPSVVKKGLVVFTLVTETLLPLGILVPSWRRVVLWPIALLQLGILLTGNYGYFNLEVMLLCVLLAPPEWLSRLRPEPTWDMDEPSQVDKPTALWWGLPRLLVAALLCTASLGHLLWTVRSRTSVPPLIRQAMRLTAPFQAVSHYGPFASMTTTRPELVVEGSQDGITWHEYPLRFKPGDVHRAPRWNTPYQPRLDWQFWFAAMAKPSDSPWLEVLLLRILEGSPDVMWLLASDPFHGRRPTQVRVHHYQYRFTTLREKRQTGAYFVREGQLPFISPVGLSVGEP